MSERRRSFLKSIGGVAGIGLVAGCSGQSDDLDEDTDEETTAEPEAEDEDEGESESESESEDDPAEAGLRVAHLSPDAPNVDVYVDGDAVLEDVPFGAFGDFLEVVEGSFDVEITAAGDPDTVVFDRSVDVPAGNVTAAAVGELAEQNQPFSVELYEDELELPADSARVRAIHAAPDAPNVDVTVAETGDVLFEDVPFGAADAVEVPEGTYTLEVRPATDANDGDVVATFDVELAAETVYTAAATGYLEPSDAPADEPFDLVLEVDAGADDAGSVSNVQFRAAHLAPDAPNVDVLVDGDPVLEDVTFAEVSDALEVAPDTYDVAITAAGDPDTAVFHGAVDLETDTTAAAIGELAEENESFAVQLLEDDRSSPGENARVRAFHASPDAPNVDVTVEETGDVLFEDVPFGGAGAVEVPAGAYTLEIRPASDANDGDVVATFDVEVAAGGVYSAFAVGYLEPSDAPAAEHFDLVVTVDRDPNDE